ncbi:efflux RND transporter periplasmic adaptor subunit, partial [Candidatus Sumerlaeota bacterium]|nr:efflux RND transporter periplasmic adaptor subunit [Candidatus Sumerlaeota bacterium]
RIVDLYVVEIPIQTPASDAGDVSIASRVEIRLPQAQGRRWKGKVVRISPEIDPLNRTVSLYVQVDNEALESPLLPGQLVEAGIQGRLYRKTIVIPRRALIDGNAFVKIKDRAERRRLEVIRAIGDDLLVASGLREGEEIILTNLEVLYDGARVITSHEMNALLQIERAASAGSAGPAALAKSTPPGAGQN